MAGNMTTDGQGGPAPPRVSPAPAGGKTGGIGRLAYFGGMIAATLVTGLFTYWCVGIQGPLDTLQALALLFFSLTILLIVVVVVLLRLQNIGMSRLWILGFLVPILNIVIGFCCLICPQGYRYTKELDPAGKAIAVVLIVLFLLGLAILLYPILSGGPLGY